MKSNSVEGDYWFDTLYVTISLFLGISTILAFIALSVWLLIVFNFFAILFLAPLFMGIWYGLKKEDKNYTKPINLNQHKKLKNLLRKLNEQTGVKNPDRIYLSVGTGISVSGLRKKNLHLGLVALRYMNEEEMLAILAHEYGHYSGKDTVFGYMLYRIQYFFEVQKEVNIQAIDFSIGVIVHIPAAIFFWIISKYFAILTFWHKRRREYRADRYASDIVGRQEFANALVKYVAIADIFDNLVTETIHEYLKEDIQVVNLYKYLGQSYTPKNVDIAVHHALEDSSKWEDTHPSISERLENLGIEKVEVEIKEQDTLLTNAEVYEKEASAILTENELELVANQAFESEAEERAKSEYVCIECEEPVLEKDEVCIHCGHNFRK